MLHITLESHHAVVVVIYENLTQKILYANSLHKLKFYVPVIQLLIQKKDN